MTRNTFTFLPSDSTFKANIDVADSMTRIARLTSRVSIQLDGSTWVHGDTIRLMEYRHGDRIRIGEKGKEQRFDIERITEVRVWLG